MKNFFFFEFMALAARAASLLAACFSAPLLSAQLPDPIRSIRVHGEITVGERTLNLSQATKGQDQIRSSVLAPDGSAVVTVFFNQDKIYVEEDLPDRKNIREIKGEDAAAHLLELLALNPEYHFRRENGFDRNHPLLENYSLRILRERVDDGSKNKQLIREINLMDESPGENSILRTIRYRDFFPAEKDIRVPRTITFTDNTTGESGTIHLEAFSHNVGLPDFLFEAPAVTGPDTPKMSSPDSTNREQRPAASQRSPGRRKNMTFDNKHDGGAFSPSIFQDESAANFELIRPMIDLNFGDDDPTSSSSLNATGTPNGSILEISQD